MKRTRSTNRMPARPAPVVLDRLFVSSRGTIGELEPLKVVRPLAFQTKNAKGDSCQADSLESIVAFGEEDAREMTSAIQQHQAKR